LGRQLVLGYDERDRLAYIAPPGTLPTTYLYGPGNDGTSRLFEVRQQAGAAARVASWEYGTPAPFPSAQRSFVAVDVLGRMTSYAPVTAASAG